MLWVSHASKVRHSPVSWKRYRTVSPVSKGVVMVLAGHDSRSHAGRPRRADAQRNYGQLVEQARIAFAELGVDASLDEIARRAGVASGTLTGTSPLGWISSRRCSPGR